MKLYTKREKTNKEDNKTQKILLNGNLPQDVFQKSYPPLTLTQKILDLSLVPL